MKIKRILVVVFLLTFTVTAVIAYDGKTHGNMNEKISAMADDNSKDLNSYLEALGFDDGIKTEFCSDSNESTGEEKNCEKVDIWLGIGGEQEDEPMYFRSQNHFHNPLNPWDEAGLDHLLFSGRSSIIWSQDQTNGRLVDLGGDWSWTTARKFYYAALTGNSTDLDGFVVEDGLVKETTITGKTEMNEKERSPFFAWTFRALGQVMHLAQDASVPAHTRNDVHVLYNYEKAVEKLRTEEDAIYVNAVKNSISFAPFILDGASDSLASTPIAKIIDTDAYVSDNPSVTAGQAIGLAEYSNANFFSQSTCANSDLFPFPNVSDECTELVTKNIIIDGEEREVQYYKKIACGEDNDGQGYLLSLVDAMEWWREFLALTGYDINMLDEGVYKDYAKLLIPRAVGYSKGLSDYFFRGDIDLEFNPSDYGYKLINNGDESLDGTFSLYYDDVDGIRRLVTSFGNMQVNPGDYASVNFTPPTEYEPKVANEYMLVFRGKMGEELDGVAAMQVMLQRPYIYFQARNWATVWDVMANRVATNIKNAQGEPISFPCIVSKLYAWLKMTESTGTVLFSDARAGNTYVSDHSFSLWTKESYIYDSDENCNLGPDGESIRKDLNSDTEAVFSRDNLFNTKDITTYSRTDTGEYTSVLKADWIYSVGCVYTVAELEALGACYIDYDACTPPYAKGYRASAMEHWYVFETKENQNIEYLKSGYIPTFKITAYNMATPVEEFSQTQGNIAYESYRYLAGDLDYTLDPHHPLYVVEEWETWNITYEADSPWGHIKTFTLTEDSRGGKEVVHLPVSPKIIGQYTDEIIVRAYIWQYQLGIRDSSVYQPSTPVGTREFIVNASVTKSEDTSGINPFTSMPRHASFEEALQAVIIAEWNDTGITSNPSIQIRW